MQTKLFCSDWHWFSFVIEFKPLRQQILFTRVFSKFHFNKRHEQADWLAENVLLENSVSWLQRCTPRAAFLLIDYGWTWLILQWMWFAEKLQVQVIWCGIPECGRQKKEIDTWIQWCRSKGASASPKLLVFEKFGQNLKKLGKKSWTFFCQ